MKAREVCVDGQIFFNVSLPKVETYHTGTFVDSPKSFKVFLLSGVEVGMFEDVHVPVTKLTDPKNQLDVRSKRPFRGELPVAYVKDVPEARKALSQFYNEWPSFDVRPYSPQVYT